MAYAVYSFFIFCLMLLSTAQAQVTLYQHCNYDGYKVYLGAGNHDMGALIQKGMKNDDVSAVRVSSGYKVTLYEHAGFAGRKIERTGDDGCFVNNNFNDIVSSVKVERTSAPTDRVALQYVNTQHRDNGVKEFIYSTFNQDIPLTAVDGQIPQMFLNISAKVGVYGNQRYVLFSTANSRVAASNSGRLAFNRQDLRGWYLEYVDVSIQALTPGFTLSSYGPDTSQQEGSVTSSSGINFSTGAAIDSSGPGASFSTGLDFGTSYSSNLQSFRVIDNSTGNTVKTRTKLASTNVSETWSNPKGGNAPYENSNDLIRMDVAGQFGGTPLNYLPELAISNLKLSSMGTFKAPNNFQSNALFQVTITMHLLKVEKTYKVFVVERETDVKNYSVSKIFAINMNY